MNLDLPSLSITREIQLANTENENIDAHLITSSIEGLSMERISSDDNLWVGSSEVFGGTPGKVNSCTTFEILELSNEDDVFTVFPTTISQITNQSWVGFTLYEDGPLEDIQIDILDLNGRLVKSILAEPNERRWVFDIINASDSYITIGTYVVMIKYFKADGTRKICRKLICIAP